MFFSSISPIHSGSRPCSSGFILPYSPRILSDVSKIFPKRKVCICPDEGGLFWRIIGSANFSLFLIFAFLSSLTNPLKTWVVGQSAYSHHKFHPIWRIEQGTKFHMCSIIFLHSNDSRWETLSLNINLCFACLCPINIDVAVRKYHSLLLK